MGIRNGVWGLGFRVEGLGGDISPAVPIIRNRP